MKYVRFGSTGLEVSRLVLGCMSFGDPNRGSHPWSLDEESSRPLIRQAVEAGINFFDTANVYSAVAARRSSAAPSAILVAATSW
jgi:aryl-alcohol dehydrogenase (NADP+)